MTVTVHWVEDQLDTNIHTFGLNDWGYKLAMDFLNHNQEYRGRERYEYFGIDEEIDFQWAMTEEQYAVLKNPPNTWLADDYLGAVFFGNCKIEFVFMHDREGPFIYCNMFVLGHEGYGELPDGTPYNDYEGFACKLESDLPKRRTFKSFAKHIEQDIVDVLNEYHQLIDDALKPTDPDKWYPFQRHNPIKITRRA